MSWGYWAIQQVLEVPESKTYDDAWQRKQVLKLKSGYLNAKLQRTEDITEAKLFSSEDEAHAFIEKWRYYDSENWDAALNPLLPMQEQLLKAKGLL